MLESNRVKLRFSNGKQNLILFLVFDVEIMFIIPWAIALSKLDLLGFWSMIEFLLELTVGFFYVWYVHALDWN